MKKNNVDVFCLIIEELHEIEDMMEKSPSADDKLDENYLEDISGVGE